MIEHISRFLTITYRTGSHDLHVESGRIAGIPREERLCVCNSGIQTISHILLHCPKLNDLREKYGVVDIVDGIMKDDFLVEMEHVLGIRRMTRTGS